MVMRAIAAVGLACASIAAHAEEATPTTTGDGAVVMTSAQISDYNASLANSDPAFIKCVRLEKTGSLLKRRVCRTNGDWDSRARVGNLEARDIVDRILTGGSTHGEEPAGSIGPVGSPGGGN